jgi:short subunit dehydrogenase-like uncharacterized protein
VGLEMHQLGSDLARPAVRFSTNGGLPLMSQPDRDWMIYGANGYTGRLVAEEAVRRGQRPILAGRDADAICQVARALDCPNRVFSLEPAAELAAHLQDVRLVAHCAGPFSATALPMMDACLAAKTHYLDITGEIDVIEAGASRDQPAREAGIALMPAVGFDVVPSDCLAATLAAELPDATHLELAFEAGGGLSPGTAKTSIEGLGHGGRIRLNGKITTVASGWKVREIPFQRGPRWAMTIPWGDVASAYYSTGIPNIEVYMSMPKSRINLLRWGRPLLSLARIGPVQRLWKRLITRKVHGPDAQQRAKSRSSLWGRVRNAAGATVEATMETQGGYPLTVLTTLATVERVLAGDAPLGFATPSQAFGKDYIQCVPETTIEIRSRETEPVS